MERLTIDMWADVICPWCYLGEHRLRRAVRQSRHSDSVDLRIHTFRLDPQTSTTVTTIVDYLADKYGMPVAQARAMEEGMVRRAAADGLPYTADRPVRDSFDMLRLIHLGTAHGVGWDYLSAMQTELFGGNAGAFEPDTLSRLGVDLGIPADEIRDVLATDRYADAVRADHDEAVQLGARGVPFTVMGWRLGIPGMVSVDQYTAAIDQAWDLVNATPSDRAG